MLAVGFISKELNLLSVEATWYSAFFVVFRHAKNHDIAILKELLP
jgi:hypothetical protein